MDKVQVIKHLKGMKSELNNADLDNITIVIDSIIGELNHVIKELEKESGK